eukprot:TRINITY_DN6395_c0_g1_i1.p1 TRINITY_DN6395_c0_g1~~TRINITY_DN6395_c0_g1_i1.p1  ORF type:complete len:432 (+),score=106.66 TRINITY_DN6395_c0_g1_i1:194-1297(+)
MDQGPHPLMHLGMTGSVKWKLNDDEIPSGSSREEHTGDGSEDDEEKEEKEQRSSADDFQPSIKKAIKAREAKVWPPKFWKLLLKFDGGIEMAFTNKRRLGRLWLMANPETEKPICDLGFDPYLDRTVTGEAFHEITSRRKVPVKTLLMNQAICAGLGNWMADEVLYRSSLHPCTYTSTLSKEESTELIKNIYYVVSTAVDCRKVGKAFPADWLYHYRWSKGQKATPTTKKGEVIEFVTVGGRTSAFVEKQKFNKESQEKWKTAQERAEALKEKRKKKEEVQDKPKKSTKKKQTEKTPEVKKKQVRKTQVKEDEDKKPKRRQKVSESQQKKLEESENRSKRKREEKAPEPKETQKSKKQVLSKKKIKH